jgi:LysM repeat protein
MEDYVCTYIEQYAHSDKSREKIALLVGKNVKVDDEDVLFISGMIQGKYTLSRNGMPTLTDKSWQYAKTQLNKYFSELKIVGWVFVQPGFEDYISDRLCSFQLDNYSHGLELLYVTDPIEQVHSFYKWDASGRVFMQVKGYLVYYEKNEGMHEYMLDNKLAPVPVSNTALPEETVDAGAMVRELTSTKGFKRHRHNTADKQQMLNLMGGVSFIMLLVCFVMGAGLIQNDEKLSQLQAQVDELKSSSQDVFAGYTQTQAIPQTQTQQPVTEPPTEVTTKQISAYRVQDGDTLIKISSRLYGTTDRVEDIAALNNITDNKIVVGEQLLLP